MSLLKMKWNGSERLVKFSPNKVIIGGRVYPTVKIGNQIWTAENLDWKFPYNGGTLPIGSSGDPSTPAAWYYNNDETTYGVNGNKYGLLYNWYAAIYLDNNRTLLMGFRLPTKSDYETLIQVTGSTSSASAFHLKSTTGWSSGNNGDDKFEFNGIPNGVRIPGGSFANINTDGYYWSSDEYSSTQSYKLELHSYAAVTDARKLGGFAIRLVKDAT